MNTQAHLTTLAEWGNLNPISRDKIIALENERNTSRAALETIRALWRERPAGLAEYASHYGNGDWVDAFERAMGVEK